MEIAPAVQAHEKAAAKPRGGKPPEQEFREVARLFESMFTQMLFKSMRATVQKSGFMDGGRAEEMFTGMLDTNLSEAASKRGRGIGLADNLVKMYLPHYLRQHARAMENSSKGRQFDSAAVSPGGSEDSMAPILKKK